MRVTELQLENFRNIRKLKILPCARTNVIYGKNAQGKTNIMEGLWMFTGEKSFRTSHDAELIQIGEEKARLVLKCQAEGRKQTAVITVDKKREVTLNGVQGNLNDISRLFRAVIFSPSDLSLIAEGPDKRRRFADLVIGSLYPKYRAALSRYERAVDQRNAVLKDYRRHIELDTVLDEFEKVIAKIGYEICVYRQRFCEKLMQIAPPIYHDLSGKTETFTVTYLSSGGDSVESFCEALKKARPTDCVNLSTGVGPHRDDFEIEINGVSARKYGSQGQKRSAAIALKLSEAVIIEQVTGTKPIILLDDVMSELDKTRQRYILNHIKAKQVFITCCDPANIEGLKAGKIFEVKNGAI